MNVPPIPDSLVKAIVFLRGEEQGRAWLAELPSRMTRHARQWGLRLEAIAEGGAMSCCVLCTTRRGVCAVLKIPVDRETGELEAGFLRRWAVSHASPSVLDSEAESGVYLMTRLLPGTTAVATGGTDDVRQFLGLLYRLNAPSLPAIPAQKDIGDVVEERFDWARARFADPAYNDGVASLENAEQVLELLLATTRDRHVLHADLQPKNVLNGPGDRWYAIDPLGAEGDINAEAALWAAVQTGPTGIAERLAELSDDPALDLDRLKAWAFVFATAEYRRYLPRPAERIAEYLAQVDANTVTDLIRHGPVC